MYKLPAAGGKAQGLDGQQQGDAHPASPREERCRWFGEVCRLLAENASDGRGGGRGAFGAPEVAAALSARHLHRLGE